MNDCNLLNLLFNFIVLEDLHPNFYDVINSSLRNFNQHNYHLKIMLNDPKYARWRVENVTKEDLEKVAYFFSKKLSEASARALIWYLRNVLFFQQGLDTDNRVMLIKYEDIIQSRMDVLDQAFSFIGLKNSGTYSKHLFSSSIGKNTPPEIDEEISICARKYILNSI